MTKPAFTHRPWCVTPCPTVHGGAFLFVKHNSTVSKQRSVSACKVYFTAAGASGAVDDDRRLRGGRQALHPQDQLAAGHADAAGDAHGLVLIEAPGVDDHHLLPVVDERLNLLGAERRRVTHAFHQLAKSFTGRVDVLKQLAAAAAPAAAC